MAIDSPRLVPSWSLAEFVEEFRRIQVFFFKTCGTFTHNETKKKRKTKIMIKNVPVEPDIVNISKTSHASKVLTLL